MYNCKEWPSLIQITASLLYLVDHCIIPSWLFEFFCFARKEDTLSKMKYLFEGIITNQRDNLKLSVLGQGPPLFCLNYHLEVVVKIVCRSPSSVRSITQSMVFPDWWLALWEVHWLYSLYDFVDIQMIVVIIRNSTEKYVLNIFITSAREDMTSVV